jgi:hypothetical protein
LVLRKAVEASCLSTYTAEEVSRASSGEPVPVTRILNQLPFGELDSRRFEDLTRQLVYDFRIWKRLEATGRSGGDDGLISEPWKLPLSQKPRRRIQRVRAKPSLLRCLSDFGLFNTNVKRQLLRRSSHAI